MIILRGCRGKLMGREETGATCSITAYNTCVVIILTV